MMIDQMVGFSDELLKIGSVGRVARAAKNRIRARVGVGTEDFDPLTGPALTGDTKKYSRLQDRRLNQAGANKNKYEHYERLKSEFPHIGSKKVSDWAG